MSDTTGPTRGAEERRSWSPSPAKAFAVRAVVLIAPIIGAFLVTRIASDGFWRTSGWIGIATFVIQGAVVGSATALLVDRATRRMLPLVALFNMTLVFPDQAPSRFSLALRTGTVKQLERALKDGRIDWPDNHQEAAEMLIAVVAQLGRHDRLTRGHTERVRAFCDLIGEEMGLDDAERELLHWAAMAHDIGKLTVPADILNAKDGLSDDQWRVLREHPAAGGRLVAPLESWLGEWRLAASEHHERWDGGGYPAGLAGEEISLAGRIVAVADAYDVITSTRSYKSAMSPEAARREMVRCSGAQFDPAVVRALLNASLGKERAALGFLGWLTELPGLSTIPRAVAQVGQVASTTLTATAIVAGSVAGGALVDMDADEGAAPPEALAFAEAISRFEPEPGREDEPAAIEFGPDAEATLGTVTTTATTASTIESITTTSSTPDEEAGQSSTTAATTASNTSPPTTSAPASTSTTAPRSSTPTTTGTTTSTTAQPATTTTTTATTTTTTSTSTSTTTATTTTTTTGSGTTSGAMFVYSTIGPSSTANSSRTLDVSIPSGVADGDLLMLVEANAAMQASTAPADWSPAGTVDSPSPSPFRLSVWVKPAVAGETIVPFEAKTNLLGTSAWVIHYENSSGAASPPTMVSAYDVGSADRVSAVTVGSGISTNVDDSLVISLVAVRDDNSLSLDTNQGFDQNAAETVHWTNGHPRAIALADLPVPTGGSSVAMPTWSQDNTPAQWAWITLVVE